MDPVAELVGESQAMEAVRGHVRRLLARQHGAGRFPPILLHGETGTGKGLAARIIHRASNRAAGPFVDVNCAAIPDTLLEAELFGFERGAFTDARRSKPGLFQAAHRGTIFLDEVALLPEALQAKLLNAIEERVVRRLGSTRGDPVDAWVISATNSDLALAVHERRFREDLFHRLAVITIRLPPLRERGRDVLLLAEHFLARACRDYGLAQRTLGAGASARILAHPWPGNVRELSNVMERVALLAESPLVAADLLELPHAAEPARSPSPSAPRSLDDAMRDHFRAVLDQSGWNISRSAAALGISRNTLRARIERLELRPGGRAGGRSARVRRGPASTPAIAPAIPVPGPAPTALRWERRRITLLRASLVAQSAGDMASGSSRALEMLVDKARTFGGRIEEMSPGGVTCAFGIEPVEDAPRRAVHAALAMRAAADRARREAGVRLAATIGIHVCEIQVGQTTDGPQIDAEAKRAERAVLESLVNAAEAGAIVVSEAAAPFLDRRFDLVAYAPGGHASHAYKLSGRERRGLAPGGRMAGFVGRRQELNLIQSRLASVKSGHAHIVSIVGEAGMGKSRLLHEFRQTLKGAAITYLEGHCLSFGSTIPYLPVLELLRRACRVAESDSPEAIAEKVRGSLERLGLAADDGAPYLLELLGVRSTPAPLALLSPEAIQARTFEVLRRMTVAGSRLQPLIIVVEDLHWVDRASEALAPLIQGLAGLPILLILTYRPEFEPSWKLPSHATQIALEPLSDQDGLSVVRSVLETDRVPEPLASVILARAEGNPFVLEELARVVAEQGVVPVALAVPATVEEVILARIDRVSAAARELLQTAAVLGRAVSSHLLERMWRGPSGVQEPLQELIRLDFLYELRLAAEPAYVFKHALIHEVAYASLQPVERRAIHLRAGQTLGTLYADRLDEVIDRLAHHYSNAGAVPEAIQYLTRLAGKAARAYANSEAVAAIEEALTHVDQLPAEERDERALDLVLLKAHSLYFLGRVREALDMLVAHRERLARVRAPSRIGAYYFQLGFAQNVLGDHERAAEIEQRAIEEATRAGDRATVGKASYVLAYGRASLGQFREALAYGQQAVAHLEGTEEHWWLGMAHWVLGLAQSYMGDFEAGLEAEAQARAIGEATGDPRLLSFAAWTTGAIHATKGEWETAVEICGRALARSPDPVNTVYASAFLGYAHVEKRDGKTAVSLIEPAVQQVRQFRFRQVQGWLTALLGEAYLVSGDIDRARAACAEALEISGDTKYLYGIGRARRTLGCVALAGGDLTEARTHLEEALQTFAAIDARFELGKTHLALAELAEAEGSTDAATRRLAEARAIFQRLRVPRYEDRARQMAERLAASPASAPGPADPAASGDAANGGLT